MKVVNLDKLVTKNERVIILNGKEHNMHVPTVQDYIEQMKKAQEIDSIAKEGATVENSTRVLELTIETLRKSFPTVTVEEFKALNMQQLDAIRQLAEGYSDEDISSDEQGEATEGQ